MKTKIIMLILSFLLLVTAILIFVNAVRANTIPALAYKLKPQLIREVRFWWSVDYQPTIFFGQIHQESIWNPQAISPVGAMGLTQYMPKTWDWITNLYPKEFKDSDCYDPKYAIRGMIIYDKWLIDRIDSDEKEPMMLSSYNGGLGNLCKDRKLTEHYGGDPDRWWFNVELYSHRHPSAFRENRTYVDRIVNKWIPLYRKEGF